jgi:polysaccharide biosynthesis/export protein
MMAKHVVSCLIAGAMSATLAAQPPTSAQNEPAGAAKAPSSATGAPAADALPAGYLIGPDDVLSIVFWREKDLSGDVTVRPDGNITLPLLNDVPAAGMTPARLREILNERAARYVADPDVTVQVKQINSRKVFITGEVERPGTYPLTGPLTVLQVIALAGGLKEYADAKHIVIVRNEKDRTVSYSFNFRDVAKGKNLFQNLLLKPGDTIVVP